MPRPHSFDRPNGTVYLAGEIERSPAYNRTWNWIETIIESAISRIPPLPRLRPKVYKLYHRITKKKQLTNQIRNYQEFDIQLSNIVTE
jgi:hypothetical protein